MDLVRKSDVLKLIDSVEFNADADYYVDDILNDLRLWVQALEAVDPDYFCAHGDKDGENDA